MEFEQVLGQAVKAIYEVVEVNDGGAMVSRCFVELQPTGVFEIQPNNPYQPLTKLLDCSPDVLQNAVISPVDKHCQGLKVADIVYSECWGSIGVKFQNDWVLFMEAGPYGEYRPTVLPLNSSLMTEDDLRSCVTGHPI